ncbi:MAG TPA: hypothetical protein ENK11_02290, partial [Phycisphaerales bacterium]|nr:hypothetical protein [Phycisphaerales bacterium]
MPNHTPEDRDRIDHLCGTPARTPAPLLSDLTRQLLFPRIFRAGPAAARFDRLIAAAGSILIVYAAGMIGGLYRTRQLDPPQHQFMADPLEPVR